ncbi:serine hydrolase domain-containing protein [Adhaeribacter soli]|uniref:Serine hydrolase n=1 Tax=Adhaeribacter soli TaxID=2607655 RepID=A0A5N1IVL8_9BACT|nr:serine hydrolase [Adhaeribacter soli]KAA9333817.1 serine hydrolase [Adhaeribacter soli]
MKKLKLAAVAALVLLGASAATLYITGKNYVYRALYYNFAGIDDNRIFEERILPARAPQPWPVSRLYNRQPLPAAFASKQEQLKAVAFLVIHRDSLLLEKYWNGYGPESLSNSFSVAKSVVSMLVGVALKDGKIKSIDQPVGDFLPEFKQGRKSKITLRHLLAMSSGLNWDESYSNPLSMTTEAYYGNDLKSLIHRQEVETEPGKEFFYKSGNTQVLALVLQAATGQSISAYAANRLWKPLGAEHAAEWSLDKKDGVEKAYCCLYSNARDFARLGQLYLKNGIWKGDTLVPPAYVKASLTPTHLPDKLSGAKGDFYGLHWWLIPDYKGLEIFYARGILGQYIIMVPEKELVIVRLGEKRGEKKGMHLQDVYDLADAALGIVK